MAILPKRFCFRFSVKCPSVKTLWSDTADTLTDAHTLPAFDELEGGITASGSGNATRPIVKLGWCDEGVVVSCSVTGKKTPTRCSLVSPEQCEGIQICIDTRDVRNVHRATRFCHRFLIAPCGASSHGDQPAVLWLPISRAKGVPNAVDAARIKIRSNISRDGYSLTAAFPADILTGFDPASYPRLGFHYAIIDRELGNRYWLTPPVMPQDQDPSLWGTVELV
ncbi:MAG: hypothetical protein ACRC46_06410 [Thermoguttaceae bacterium]